MHKVPHKSFLPVPTQPHKYWGTYFFLKITNLFIYSINTDSYLFLSILSCYIHSSTRLTVCPSSCPSVHSSRHSFIQILMEGPLSAVFQRSGAKVPALKCPQSGFDIGC